MHYHPYNSPSSSQSDNNNGLLGEILRGQKELKEMVKKLTSRVEMLEEDKCAPVANKPSQKLPAELSVSNNYIYMVYIL